MNTKLLLVLTLLCAQICAQTCTAQTTLAAPTDDAQLKYVVYVSRHGVRSPTGKAAQYDQFAAAPWPTWDVRPGYLTPHGFQLMQLFGNYDRLHLSAQHLLAPQGCAESSAITIYADTDERTRETGRALAAGLAPSCKLPVLGLAEGLNDPIFHLPEGKVTPADATIAAAAIAGRLGNDPHTLAQAYHTQLAAFDHILATCGTPTTPHKRTSLFDIPATLAPGTGDHAADLKGPINTASTLAEIVLLEYTQGLAPASVAWGCIDGPALRSLIDLHTQASDFALRTPAVATMQASNLLNTITASLTQAATGKPVPGTPGKPTDRVLVLVGHDTNLTNLSGMLGLTWVLDGRRDDTPPGAALVFELWQSPSTKTLSVRVSVTAQTLEQMHDATPLTLDSPPARVPLFLPACSRADLSCTLPDFLKAMHQAIDPRFVTP